MPFQYQCSEYQLEYTSATLNMILYLISSTVAHYARTVHQLLFATYTVEATCTLTMRQTVLHCKRSLLATPLHVLDRHNHTVSSQQY